MERDAIYGAGNMGRAVLELLRDRCEVIGFIDGNPALQGTEISSVPVYHLSDVKVTQGLHNTVVLVAMTVRPFSEMKERLLKRGFCNIVPAGDYVAECYPQDEILNTWKFQDFPDTPPFADEKSLSDYHAACRWFTQRFDEDWALEGNKYFPDFLSTEISRCSVMLDTAALDGGYIDYFLQRNAAGCVYSYVLTPPTLSTETLLGKHQDCSVTFFDCEASEQDGTVSCRRIGLMQPFTREKVYTVPTKTIDTVMKNTAFDYLRCYSMSETLSLLRGGAHSIQKYRPVIAVNIGHYRSDFLHVPPYLVKQCPNYKFYFRMHSYQGNDCIMYAVPDEKCDLR